MRVRPTLIRIQKRALSIGRILEEYRETWIMDMDYTNIESGRQNRHEREKHNCDMVKNMCETVDSQYENIRNVF